MEVEDLFRSCRQGDLEQVCGPVTLSVLYPAIWLQVEYLAEQREVDLNTRDRWDSTPLYYACLCGHLELVSSAANVTALD